MSNVVPARRWRSAPPFRESERQAVEEASNRLRFALQGCLPGGHAEPDPGRHVAGSQESWNIGADQGGDGRHQGRRQRRGPSAGEPPVSVDTQARETEILMG